MKEPQLFTKKRLIEVEAMRLELDNGEQVLEWIRRFSRRVDLIKTVDQIEVRIYGSRLQVITARRGYWITHDEDGMFRVWLPFEFDEHYEAAVLNEAVTE